MKSNPYAPPTAGLADPPDPVVPRPRAVNVAIGLLLGMVLVRILVQVHALYQSQFQSGTWWQWLLRAGGVLLMLVLCQQVAQRRNWARVVLGILVFLQFAGVCYGVGAARRYLSGDEMMSIMPRFLGTQVLPMVMGLAAMHLLWLSSGDWFRRDAGN